jgi:hypothetical protein
MTKRDNRRYGIGCLVMLALVTFALLALPEEATPPANQAPPVATSAAPTSELRESLEAIAAAEAHTAQLFPQEKLRAGAPPAPVTGACYSAACARARVEFEHRSWPRAWRGDYQEQRNVAFCLMTGCDAAVEVRKAEACAWRSVILAVNAKSADDTDASNLAMACKRLDPAGAELAKEKVAAILEQLEDAK